MKGQLSEHPLAELIREITSGGLSGALRLARGRAQAVAYAVGGEVVSARSNLRVHRLAECARRAGLDAEGRVSAFVTEAMSDAEAASALVHSGTLTAEGLTQLRALQAADVLRPFLLWTDGLWGFDPRARPADGERVSFDTRRLLLEGAQHLPAAFAAARLADDAEVISPAAEHTPPELQLKPVEGYVLSRVERPTALGEIVAAAGLPADETRRAVYALSLCGLLARERWPVALAGAAEAAEASAQAERAAAPADPRGELELLLERVADDADYFEILGVERGARPADIKRAYYSLAKRFHPDRFRQIVSGDEERVSVEHAFALVTKAYETLYDQQAREAYAAKHPAKSSPAGLSSVFGKRKSATAAKVTVREEARPRHDPTATPQYRAEDSFQQGLAAAARGDHGAAQAYFGEAVRLGPQEARYRALYGRTLARAPATRHQAEAELQAAVRLDPRNVAYHVALAELYAAIGLRRRAEGQLSRALALDPAHEPARRMLERMKGNDER